MVPPPPASEPSGEPSDASGGAPRRGEPAAGAPVTIAAFLRALTPHAWVTPTLVVLILVAFASELARGVGGFNPSAESLLKIGGLYGPSVADGEWWRVATSVFLHAGVLHLALNVWVFWSQGAFAERVFGNAAFLAIYLLSGFGGALTSLAVHPMTVSVGASGAIFGVYGAVLAFVLLHRGVLPGSFLRQQRNGLLTFVVINAVFGLSQPYVDVSAHAGGLVTGLFAGALLARDLTAPSANRGLRVASVLAMVGLLAYTTAPVGRRVAADPQVRAGRAETSALGHLKARELPQAILDYSTVIDLDPSAASLSNRGIAYLWSGDVLHALEDFKAAHALEPTPRTAALVCDASAKGAKARADVDAAVKACSEAVALDPKSAEPLAYRASLHAELDETDLALADADAALALDTGSDLAHRVRLLALLAKGDEARAEDDCAALLSRAAPDPFELRNCARVALVRGDKKAERARLDACLAVAKADPVALLLRAELNGTEGRVADSIADYTALVAVSPDAGVAWNNLAWMEILQGDFPSARTHADRSVALLPDDAANRGTRCFALAGLGLRAEARLDCARAVALDPNLADRGMLAYLSGDLTAARQLWTEASGKDPVMARELAAWLGRL